MEGEGGGTLMEQFIRLLDSIKETMQDVWIVRGQVWEVRMLSVSVFWSIPGQYSSLEFAYQNSYSN